MLVVNLIPCSGGGEPQQTLALMMVEEEEEECPITLQPMRLASVPPLAAHPTRIVAQLALCGHRFSAMPLLTFFCSTNMRCPLCRQGSATQRLSVRHTFPGEAWTEALQTQCDHNNSSDDDDGDQLFFLTRLGVDQQRRLDLEVEVEPQRLRAVFALYDGRGAVTSLAEYPLHFSPHQALRDLQARQPRYILCGDSLRALGQQVTAHRAASLHVQVTADDVVASTTMQAVPARRQPFSVLMRASQLVLIPTTTAATTIGRVTSFVFIPHPHQVHG